MKLMVGQRWASTVCDTEVIVVRGGAGEYALRCGGAPLTEVGTPEAHAGPLLSEPEGEGTQIGKRYTDADGRLELLCTKPGHGGLTLDDVALTLKAAKTLPSSD